jgi:predicted ATP-dependent serine protease
LQNEIKNLESLISTKSSEIKDFDEQIKRLDKDKSKLNGRLDKLIDSCLNVWRHNNKKTQVIQKNEASEKSPQRTTKPVPVDVQNLTFELLKFTGHASVLDQLDHTKAFVFLKGEPGAGKTHFSFLLLQCFIKQHGFNCAYLSIEEGASKKNHDLCEKLKIKGLFTLYDSGSVETLEILCKEGNNHGRFDAIFIDSWQKLILGTPKTEQDTLVQKFRTVYPKIIFVVISQVTKSGDIRGSNELKHDASLTLEIQKNSEGNRSIKVIKSRMNGETGEIYEFKNS